MIIHLFFLEGGMRRCNWYRHCAKSQKVVSLIPNRVIGICRRHKPSSCTMALWLTQPLTERRTRNTTVGVNAASAEGWQPYHLHVPTVWKSGSLNPLESFRPVQACTGIVLLLLIISPCYTLYRSMRIPLILISMNSTFTILDLQFLWEK